MKKGDLVEVTMNWTRPPSVRYFVRVKEVNERAIFGPYAWQPDGKVVSELQGDGAFLWSDIEKVEVIEFAPKFNDGDVVKPNSYTYERINGKWYMQTEFTDETIEGAKDNTPIQPYVINIDNGTQVQAQEIDEYLQKKVAEAVGKAVTNGKGVGGSYG